MIKFYLDRRKIFWGYGLISVAYYFFLPWYWALLVIALLTFYLFLYRIRPNSLWDESTVKNGVYYAPVNGVVEEAGVLNGNPFVRVAVPLFSDFGIRLPCDGNIEDVQFKSSGHHFRYFKNLGEKILHRGTVIEIEDRFENQVNLILFKCYLGGSPRLWVRTGDRGRAGCPIGYFPFGGSVVLFLPQGAKVFVDKGEVLKGSETPVAGLSA